MKLGMVGLGRMGNNMAERLRAAGHQVVGYDPKSEATDVGTLDELAAALEGDGPRVVWSMVPSGNPTEETVVRLGDVLGAGDVIVDGGNSNWKDTVRRAEAVGERGIGYVDAGTSGGVWGRDNGYALMVGGADEHVAVIWPALEALAPGDGKGLAHVGPVGSGHFTKMVHNGIEYAMMQALAEGYAVLSASELGIDVPGALGSWQHGSVVRSWLLDLFVLALEQSPNLDDIAPVAADSGEGRWTVEEAIRLGVSVPAISASLFARFVSQDTENVSMRAIAALRHQFGGHAFVAEKAAAGADPDEKPVGSGGAG